MEWARLILFGIPLAVLGAGGWAGWRARTMGVTAGEDRVMLLPGALPVLNPFLPASEAERQVLDLVHESLLRVDDAGRLAPGLAETWAWHQEVTCWFTAEDGVKQAQARLAALPPEQRAAWELESVTTRGLSLVLRFARPGSVGADEALRVLEGAAPRPLSFLRVEVAGEGTSLARDLMETYVLKAAEGVDVRRLWFDDDGACELVTTLPALQAQEALTRWLDNRKAGKVVVTPLAEVSGLLEPVLEFRLRESAAWPGGGGRVTARDLRATLRAAMEGGWPVPGREALRQVQEVEEAEPGVLRVVYRKKHGPALMAWTTLPVLPAAWLEAGHQPGEGDVPGAGSWRVASRQGGELRLESTQPPVRRLRLLGATSPLQARVGLATGTFDIIWPNPGEAAALEQVLSARVLPAPPRGRVQLVWNTLSTRLRDVRVREGLALLLDKQTLGAEVLHGTVRPYAGFFPPGLWFTPAVAPAPKPDAEAAEARLSAAGWLKDVAGVARTATQALDLRLLIPAGNAARLELARAIAAAWAAAGARVEVVEAAGADFATALRTGKFDAALIGLGPDPSWDLAPFWHTPETGGDLNVSGLADPQLDLLLEALASTFDPAEVPARAADIQRRLAELRPAEPLFTDLERVAVRASRFPGLAEAVPPPYGGVVLRQLMQATRPPAPPVPQGLKMLVPKD